MTSLPSCLRLASGEPVTTNHSSADGHKNLAVEYTMSGGGKGPEKQCSLSSNYASNPEEPSLGRRNTKRDLFRPTPESGASPLAFDRFIPQQR